MTRQTRHLIAAELFSHLFMRRGLRVRSGARVTMQTFAIVKGFVERKFLRHLSQIVNVNMFQAAHFRLGVAKHCVIRMASEASVIPWNPVVLKVRCRKPGGVIDPQAFAVRLHHMARQTELGRFRMIQMDGGAQNGGHKRKNEKSDKSEYLSTRDSGE